MEIGFNKDGLYVKSMVDHYYAPVELYGEEAEAFNLIKNILVHGGIDISTLKAVQRSKGYVTLLLNENNDFCRLHFGERSKWISLDIRNVKKYQDDVRFEDVPNKKIRHWKVKLAAPIDIVKFGDVLVSELNFVPPPRPAMKPIPANENEKLFIDEVLSSLPESMRKDLKIERITTNALNFYFKERNIGTVKLYGRTTLIKYFDKKGWHHLERIPVEACFKKIKYFIENALSGGIIQ